MTTKTLLEEVTPWLGSLADDVSAEGATDATLIASPLAALAHIGLELVEQTRIRNRIAASERWGNDPAAWPSEIREALS